ncbi:cobalamin-binding protein [uncultured Marinobacter sp.]|uniref:cobalamin-binding protein n=1 Tax=uncultured Marinobacter sp. TaxID=187379 RepID=UPI000C4342A7|nr:cobalamin-binding protein [Oceanospirillales bacterium]|tara:strand:+ start:6941 stop:7825 length:885 start_codon:yes stop_codon:yes gene_type:complete
MSTALARITGLVLLLLPLAALAGTHLCATDALSRQLCLQAPAGRVISLSPGTTELLFSAGAGAAVVAVSAWSDYPPEAARLPRVGDSNRLDLERILALRPDLVVAWSDGNSRTQMDRLEALGIPVFWLAPRDFGDIAAAVVALGRLTGHEARAQAQAEEFLAGIAALQARYADAAPVRVFYQVWDRPLMTVNGEELISKAIALCGGRNIFASLPRLVPRVTEEAVLAADPEAIVTSGQGDSRWLDDWRRFPELTAVARNNLFLVTPSLLQRPTFRVLEGSRELCLRLEQARDSR